MIFSKKKDLQNRNLYNKKELEIKTRKFLFLYLLNSNSFTKIQKNKFVYLFLLTKKNKNKNKIVRRCVVTNRSRGNLKKFNVSRLLLREMFHLGAVPGYSKAVW